MEELVSWVQHAYNAKLVLEFASFCSISIKVVYMTVYFSGQVTAFIISLEIIPVSVVVISSRWSSRWSTSWRAWWSSRASASTRGSSSSWSSAHSEGSCRRSKIIRRFSSSLPVQVLSLQISDFICNSCRWSHRVIFLYRASSSYEGF